MCCEPCGRSSGIEPLVVGVVTIAGVVGGVAWLVWQVLSAIPWTEIAIGVPLGLAAAVALDAVTAALEGRRSGVGVWLTRRRQRSSPVGPHVIDVQSLPLDPGPAAVTELPGVSSTRRRAA